MDWYQKGKVARQPCEHRCIYFLRIKDCDKTLVVSNTFRTVDNPGFKCSYSENSKAITIKYLTISF